jgi:hypothetical protein
MKMKKIEKRKKMKNIIFGLMLIGAIIFSFLISSPLRAETETQDNNTSLSISAVETDENVTATDLGIKEPKISSNNFFYSLKEIWGNIGTALTIDPVKRGQKRIERASEKLIEAQKLVEEKNQPERAKNAIQKYEKEMARLQETLKKIEKKGEANAEKLTDRIINNSWQHQNIINSLEKKIDSQYFKEIDQARQQSIRSMSTVIEKFVPNEKIEEKMEKILLEQKKGSEFKDWQNLQNIQTLEENIINPEQKEEIQAVREKIADKVKAVIANASEEEKEKIDSYLENIGGEEIQKLKIIEEFFQEKDWSEAKENMNHVKEKIMEKVSQKVKSLSDENQEIYLNKLSKNNDLNELRLIKELEYNLPSSTPIKNKMEDAKSQIIQKISQEIEKQEGNDDFLLQISEKDDIQQLEILQEIKKSLPLEKQRPLQEAEEKIANSIRQKISTTTSFDEKEEALRRISGNQPEQMRIIQNLDALDEKTKGEIIKKQIEKVEEKIQNANNSDYLQQLQERVRQEEEKGEASGEIIRVRERIEEKLEEMKKEGKRTQQSSSEINQPELKNSLEIKETKEERTINLPVIENLQPLSEETDSQIINPAPRESVSPQVKKDILIDEQPIEEERPSSSLSVPQEKQRNRQSR